jgi:hypothetical protein
MSNRNDPGETTMAMFAKTKSGTFINLDRVRSFYTNDEEGGRRPLVAVTDDGEHKCEWVPRCVTQDLPQIIPAQTGFALLSVYLDFSREVVPDDLSHWVTKSVIVGWEVHVASGWGAQMDSWPLLRPIHISHSEHATIRAIQCPDGQIVAHCSVEEGYKTRWKTYEEFLEMVRWSWEERIASKRALGVIGG